MATLSVLAWIGNAAAVLLGRHGDVSRQARQHGCSRQAAYHQAAKVQHAVAEAQQAGPDRVTLLQEIRRLRQQVTDLQRHVRERIDLGPGKQHRLAVTLFALGLSLDQTEDTFALLLDGRGPDRSTIGHWVRRAQQRAGRVLGPLDAACQQRVRSLCSDEIFFHGQPALVGVEPASMALLLCRRVPDRTADTWQEALAPFTRLEYVAADAGKGLQAALRQLDEQRRQQGATGVERGLDHFHTAQEAQRVLARRWQEVESRWAEAEQAERRRQQARADERQDARGPAARARAAWRKAEQAMRRYDHEAAAWQRARAALRLFEPDGRLNERTRAEPEVRAAAAELRGEVWKKVRSFLQDARTLAYLDRVHRKLAEAEPRAELREALVRLWGLQRVTRPRGSRAGEGVWLGAALVQAVLCQRLAEDWQESYRRVAAVLETTVRASSAVECVNSILRMQQGRHRRMTQGMLDLKRLYWNCRPFRNGQRRGRCPYEHLGLHAPTYDFWELLQRDPEQLAQELSTPQLAA